jgi:hypothetical protein
MRSIFYMNVLTLLLGFNGCGRDGQSSDSPAAPSTQSPAPQKETISVLKEHRDRANSDDAASIEEAAFHGIARALVIRHVEPNKLGVGGANFRVKRNPLGKLCFVYDPRTRLSGVERNLVWLALDETRAYALNSPGKMVTPTLKLPREDGIDAPPTDEIVAYVFEGKPISAPAAAKQVERTPDNTFTVAEYRIYRAVIDAPMSVEEAEAIRRAAKVHGVPAVEAKTIVTKVQRSLHMNKWFGSAASEIKHASDWNGQKP